MTPKLRKVTWWMQRFDLCRTSVIKLMRTGVIPGAFQLPSGLWMAPEDMPGRPDERVGK